MKHYTFHILILVFVLMYTIAPAQNVGIGTATPTEKLHVAGGLRVDDLQTATNATTTTDKVVWVDANGKVYALPAGLPGRVLGMSGAGVLAWLNPGVPNALNDGQIWIGDNANLPVAQIPSGDATISNTGVITIQDDAVDGSDISITGESNGALMYFNGTDWISLGLGAPNQVLTVSGGVPAWVNLPAAPTTGDLTTTTPGVSVTNGTGAVLGSGTSVTVATNGLNQNGLVPGPSAANGLQVWGTDALGTPGWIDPSSLVDVDNGLYYNGVAGKIRQGGALVENTTIDQGNFNYLHQLSGTGVFEARNGAILGSGLIATPDNLVGVGATPHASAKLHIAAYDKGLLIPNVALTDITVAAPVVAPATSLLVYNTATAGTAPNDVTPGYYYWTGTEWARFDTGNNIGDWKLDGNNNGSLRSIGTNDNFDLPFETNGTEKVRLTNNGKLLIGTPTASVVYPWAALEIADDDGDNSDFLMRVGTSGYLRTLMQTSSGTLAAPTADGANEVIGIYDFQSHDGTTYQSVAQMFGATGAGFAAGNVLGRLGFSTKNVSDGGPVERMTIAPTGNVGVNNTNPLNKVDIIGGGGRTGTHPTGRALYVTGTYGFASNGVEFRHDNGTQGIGFGYNTIYATGSNANQDISVQSIGTGFVGLRTDNTNRVQVLAGGNTAANTVVQIRSGYLDNTPLPKYATFEIPGVNSFRFWDNVSVDNNLAVGYTYTQHRLQIPSTQTTANFPDQYNYNSGSLWIPNAGTRWQSFTAGQSGSWVELRLAWVGGAGTTTLNIYDGEGTAGTLLSTVTITKAPGLQSYILPVAIPVVAGQQYTFEVMDISGQLYVGTQYTGGIYSGNAGGDWWFEIILANATTTAFMVSGETGGGNVGVGTHQPQSRLHVAGGAAGNVQVDRGAQIGSRVPGHLNTGTTNTEFGAFMGGGLSSGMRIISEWDGVYNDEYIAFYTHNGGVSMGERMRINRDGQVGIGTNAPDQLLSVNGNASKVGGGAWATFSDQRLKKDIQPFQDGLNKLLSINPVSFQYNGLGGYPANGKTYIGVIAQEVRSIAPYMVETISKKLQPSDKDETELLMYDPSALSYITINAIKEQQQLIEQQRKEIERLKGLEAQIANLEARLSRLDGNTSPSPSPTIMQSQGISPQPTSLPAQSNLVVPASPSLPQNEELDQAMPASQEQLEKLKNPK